MPTLTINNLRTPAMRRVAGVLAALGCLSALAAGPALAQAGADGEWTMPGKDYASTRFSKLAEITSANATRLRPVWTFSTGVLAGHQGQPLVVKNTMYVVTPWPNVLYAFDLTQEGYPLKWKYRPDVSPNAIGDCLLRRDQPGRVLRRRQDHLQPARRPHGRGGRGSRARSCGRPRSPISARARRRRWRRSSSRIGSSSAPRAASSASTAGSRGSISRPARSSGPGATSAPTPRCWSRPAPSSRSTTRAPTSGKTTWPDTA